MLNHTKKIKELYEDIQKKIFYIIPEKWEKLYLYSSVLDNPDREGKTGELFCYYIPKGIFKKKPINVYEIPSRFNLDENEYLKLVEILYEKIKQLKDEFKKSETEEMWTNLTITIQNLKFKVEYDYSDLENSDFTSYERHVVWRYNYLGITPEQVSKEEREILKRYFLGAKTLSRKEHYDAGIYIKDIQNIIGYSTQDYDSIQNVEYVATKNQKANKNQILLSEDEIKQLELKNKIK